MKTRLIKLQISLDVLTWGAVLGLFVLAAAFWPALPPRIASHFDSSGAPDGYSGRGVLLLCPILAALLCGGVDAVGHLLPEQCWNIPFSVPEGRKPQVYSALRTMLLLLNLECVLCFLPAQLGLCLQRMGPLAVQGILAMVVIAMLTAAGGIYLAWRKKFEEPDDPSSK